MEKCYSITRKTVTSPSLRRTSVIMYMLGWLGKNPSAEPTAARAYFLSSWYARNVAVSFARRCGTPTDQYRQTIWQCNGKFTNNEHCHTPTLDTETIQRLFIRAYWQLMPNRKQTIVDCKFARKCLTDFTALNSEIERQFEGKHRSLPKWSRRRSKKRHPPHSPRKPI